MNETGNTSPKLTSRQQLVSSGLAAGLAAYFLWGFFPVYFKLTESVPALEILAHRIVWGAPFAAIIILLRKQWPAVFKILKHPKTLLMFVMSSILIGVNWGVYVWAVQIDEIFQASLGYYINPLLNVVIGIFFFKESLNKLQYIAAGLAAIGVLILTTYGGVFPYIALILALSFGFYGVVRKKVDAGAMPGLFVECAILFLPSLAYLYWLYAAGDLKFFYNNTTEMDALMLLLGPMTVIPLFFFAVAARRMPLSTLGFLQYIAPTLQFACALYYGEAFTAAHAWCFGFIWIAVIIFSIGAWQKSKHAPIS